MKDLSDKELVRKCLADPRSFSAFDEIVRRYEPLVYRYNLKYLRNEEWAREISQEVFLKVYGHLSTLKKAEQLKSWIMSIASNACTNKFRKEKRHREIQDRFQKESPSSEETSAPLSRDAKEEKIELLKASLEKLNPQDQEILNLHYFSDLTVKEVAEHLEMTESAVKMRLSRARDKIQKKMEKKL